MVTLDLKKDLKPLYFPSAKAVQLVDVPRFKFLMIDGEIEAGHRPGDSPRFAEDLEAMYGAAYTLKFASKLRKENPVDYPVMALEGLWWTETGAYDLTHPEGWKYRVMILQPGHITDEMLAAALVQLRKKKPGPALERLRLEEFEEGRCIQIMHIGLWSATEANAPSAAYLTLLVTPQDALVLKFLRETTTGVQFALRGAGNHTVVRTQPVIIDYVDQRFNFAGNLVR